MPLFLRFYQLCDDNLRLAAAKDGGVGILEGTKLFAGDGVGDLQEKTGLGMDAEIVKADAHMAGAFGRLADVEKADGHAVPGEDFA